MVGLLARSTNNNIEQQAHEFATYTIRPWLVRIERSAALNLLLDPKRYKVRFTMEDLLRGDPLKRSQSLQIQRQNGVINGDEWRALEGRNPIEDGSGREYWRPSNMMGTRESPRAASPVGARVAEARCPEPGCGKLLGKNVADGTLLWCPGCKAEKRVTGAGGEKQLRLISRKRTVRNEDGTIAEVIEEAL